jgi:flagellar motor protein MotB
MNLLELPLIRTLRGTGMLQVTSNFRSTVLIGASLASVLLLSSACVSNGKYQALEEDYATLQRANEMIVERDMALYETNIILNEEIAMLDDEVAIMMSEQDELAIELEALIIAGTVKMELMKSGLNLYLDESVLFTSGSATIKPSGVEAISGLVDELEGIPYQIVVIGNSDNVPVGPKLAETFPSNWALAAGRASAVVALMAAEGIPAQQLVAVSLGDTQPIASNDTPEGRAENRRIEVRLRPIVKD